MATSDNTAQKQALRDEMSQFLADEYGVDVSSLGQQPAGTTGGAATTPTETGAFDYDSEVQRILGDTPVVTPPEPEQPGIFPTLAKRVRARTADVVGGAAEFAREAGENLESMVPLGGFIPDDQAFIGFRYAGPEEFAEQQQKGTDILTEAATSLRNVGGDFEEITSWQDVKDSYNDPESPWYNTAGNAVAFGLETGVASLPDMVALVMNAPAYVTARTGEIANERATNDNREVEAADLALGGVTSLAVTLLDRLGLDTMINASRIARATGDGLTKSIVKGAGAGALGEGVTETGQELIEYLATHVGTEKGASLESALDVMLGALVAGKVYGGTAGGIAGGVEALSEPTAAPAPTTPVEETPAPSEAPVTPEDPAAEAAEKLMGEGAVVVDPTQAEDVRTRIAEIEKQTELKFEEQTDDAGNVTFRQIPTEQPTEAGVGAEAATVPEPSGTGEVVQQPAEAPVEPVPTEPPSEEVTESGTGGQDDGGQTGAVAPPTDVYQSSMQDVERPEVRSAVGRAAATMQKRLAKSKGDATDALKRLQNIVTTIDRGTAGKEATKAGNQMVEAIRAIRPRPGFTNTDKNAMLDAIERASTPAEAEAAFEAVAFLLGNTKAKRDGVDTFEQAFEEQKRVVEARRRLRERGSQRQPAPQEFTEGLSEWSDVEAAGAKTARGKEKKWPGSARERFTWAQGVLTPLKKLLNERENYNLTDEQYNVIMQALPLISKPGKVKRTVLEWAPYIGPDGKEVARGATLDTVDAGALGINQRKLTETIEALKKIAPIIAGVQEGESVAEAQDAEVTQEPQAPEPAPEPEPQPEPAPEPAPEPPPSTPEPVSVPEPEPAPAPTDEPTPERQPADEPVDVTEPGTYTPEDEQDVVPGESDLAEVAGRAQNIIDGWVGSATEKQAPAREKLKPVLEGLANKVMNNNATDKDIETLQKLVDAADLHGLVDALADYVLKRTIAEEQEYRDAADAMAETMEEVATEGEIAAMGRDEDAERAAQAEERRQDESRRQFADEPQVAKFSRDAQQAEDRYRSRVRKLLKTKKDVEATRKLLGGIASGEVNTTQQAAQIIRGMSRANPIKRLFDILDAQDVFGDETQLTTDTIPGAMGRYNASMSAQGEDVFVGQERVRIDRQGVANALRSLDEGDVDQAAQMLQVLAHEMVHEATSVKIATDPEARAAIQPVFDAFWAAVKGQVQRGDPANLEQYGLTNELEFVAEALTNPAFQRVLMETELPADFPFDRQKASLWDYLIDVISKVLGVKGKVPYNYLDAVLSVVPDITASVEERRLPKRGAKKGVVELTSANTAKQISNESVKKLGLPRPKYALSTLGSKVGELKLWVYTLNDLKNQYADRFKSGAFYQYMNSLYEKTRLVNTMRQEANNILIDWSELKGEFRAANLDMGQLMLDSTLQGVDPTKSWNDPTHRRWWATYNKDGTLKKSENNAKRRQWQQMQAELKKHSKAREIYIKVRDFYQDQRDQIQRATTKYAVQGEMKALNVNPSEVDALADAMYKAETTAERTKVLEDHVARNIDRFEGTKEGRTQKAINETVETVERIFNATNVEGPYFPARRFGNNVVTMKRSQRGRDFDNYGEALDYKRKVEAGLYDRYSPYSKVEISQVGDDQFHTTINERQVHMRESKGEAERLRDALVEKYPDATVSPVEVKMNHGQMLSDAGLSTVAERLKNNLNDPTAVAQIDRVLAELAAENSLRKSTLARQGIEGASTDMERVFAERAVATAWTIADLLTSRDQGAALTAMEKDARGNYTLQQVVEHIRGRETQSMNRDRSPGGIMNSVEELLTRSGFYLHLASLSYSVVNMTQVPLVAYPKLAGDFNPISASKALFIDNGPRAMMATMREMARTRGGFTSMPDELTADFIKRLGKRDPDKAQMFQTLVDRQKIDATFIQELFDTARRSFDTELNGVSNVLQMSRALPQMIEQFNRLSVSGAAYDLSMARDGNKAKATQYAQEAIDDTQFDYSQMNRPRLFKMPMGRVVFMFKMYAQGMYSLLLRTFARGYMGWNRGLDLENRARATSTLAGLIGMHSLAAGVSGGLLMEPVRMMMNAYLSMFDEDDERDLQMRVDAWLAKNFGDAWEVMSYGVPRAVGFDLFGRVGLHNLVTMSDTDFGDPTRDKMVNTLIGSLGPMGSFVFDKVPSAVDKWDAGQKGKAVETIMPKAVRDVMAANRLTTEGATTTSGKRYVKPEEFSASDAFWRGVGFRSQTEARKIDAKWAKEAFQRRVETKKSKLMRRWFNAADADTKQQVWRNEIQPFNRRYRDFRITKGDLFKQRARRRKEERQARAGVATRKRSVNEAFQYAEE